MRNKKIKWFERCVPVKGLNRGVVFDLQRGDFHSVPNSILEIIEEYSGKGIYELFNDFKFQKNILKKYIRYFLNHELIFVTSNLENFPKMELDVYQSYLIESVIIEVDTLEDFKIKFFEKELKELRCNSINLIIKQCSDNLNNVIQIINLLEGTKIHDISLLLPYNLVEVFSTSVFFNDCERLKMVLFFNEINGSDKRIDKELSFELFYTNQDLESFFNRRIICQNDFAINLFAYLESMNNNLFFNKIVYIENNGNVRNYFNDNQCFGTIKHTSLTDIIQNSEIKKLWNLKKDQIEVCRDCEFRYVCPDNRIPILEKNRYYHESDCNYNPYTNEWKNE